MTCIAAKNVIESETVFSGNLLEVRRDMVRAARRRDGRRGNTSCTPGAVMVVPLLDDGRLVLERQFRYPVGRVMLEFPAGKIDAGEPVWQCAMRELVEETGYRAREWARAGVLHNADRLFERRHRDLVRARPGQGRGEPRRTASSSRPSKPPRTSSQRWVQRRQPHRREDHDRACCGSKNGAQGRWDLTWRPTPPGAAPPIIGLMKVLNLQCRHGHGFEGWFASEDDYQSQSGRGLVECPMCARQRDQQAAERTAPESVGRARSRCRQAPSANGEQTAAGDLHAGHAPCARQHRGRRRALRRGSAAHPLRRDRRPRHSRPGFARRDAKRCSTRASR